MLQKTVYGRIRTLFLLVLMLSFSHAVLATSNQFDGDKFDAALSGFDINYNTLQGMTLDLELPAPVPNWHMYPRLLLAPGQDALRLGVAAYVSYQYVPRGWRLRYAATRVRAYSDTDRLDAARHYDGLELSLGSLGTRYKLGIYRDSATGNPVGMLGFGLGSEAIVLFLFGAIGP